MRRFPLVHALGPALVDDALGVAEDDIVGREADRLEQFETGDAGRARAVAYEFGRFDVAPREIERIDQAGGRDDRDSVLVVMEYRDVEEFPQPLLDDEALRCADIFEIDAAPALAEKLDAVDDFVGVFRRDFEVDRIDVGEALEQNRLAFHDRLGRQRAAVAQPQNGRAIGDDGDEIALGGIIEREVLVLRDSEHWNALGLGAPPSSLPGRPWLWNSSASWSVNVGRPPRPSFFEDISTPYKILRRAAENRGNPSNVRRSREVMKPSPQPPAPSCWRG